LQASAWRNSSVELQTFSATAAFQATALPAEAFRENPSKNKAICEGEGPDPHGREKFSKKIADFGTLSGCASFSTAEAATPPPT
jgi:hypothetical protein